MICALEAASLKGDMPLGTSIGIPLMHYAPAIIMARYMSAIIRNGSLILKIDPTMIGDSTAFLVSGIRGQGKLPSGKRRPRFHHQIKMHPFTIFMPKNDEPSPRGETLHAR